MNVRTICLAILQDCESTGYEIRKLVTEGEYSYFIEASYGSIYPALARLEEDGLVTSRVEQQVGKPAKKVYAITHRGRQEFLNSLFEEPGPDIYRSEFLLFARFAHLVPCDLIEKRILDRISALDAEIAELEKLSEKHESPADQWILAYGIKAMRFGRDYLMEHGPDLVALGAPGADADLAAE